MFVAGGNPQYCYLSFFFFSENFFSSNTDPSVVVVSFLGNLLSQEGWNNDPKHHMILIPRGKVTFSKKYSGPGLESTIPGEMFHVRRRRITATRVSFLIQHVHQACLLACLLASDSMF